MINRYSIFKGLYFTYFIACSTLVNAIPVPIQFTWIGLTPNNDMNNPANWNPHFVPGNIDNAIFDATIRGIDTNPTESTAPFSVANFNFLNSASAFHFNFNNQSLTFTGLGITGSQTNTAINIANINNSIDIGNLLFFAGSTSTSGSANIHSTNSAELAGIQSSTIIGIIDSNIRSPGPFVIANSGSMTAGNAGNDSANGTGGNGVANTVNGQVQFDHSFTAGSNVAVSISNSGIFSGTNSAQGDKIGVVNGSQFISSESFQVGDNFSFVAQNSGQDSSQGVGISKIGQLNSAQMLLNTTAVVGKNCSITLTNTGNNTSNTSGSSNIGYLNDEQFFVGNQFLAADHFTLNVSNIGTDSSTGFGGGQVAFINSNSGTTGNQILFQQGASLGAFATISATNEGTYLGANTNGGPNIGGMNLGQIAIGDSTAPGSFAFFAGDNFTLSASNQGDDEGQSTGSDSVGDVSTDQIDFYTPTTLADNAKITITNKGRYVGEATSTFVTVGSVGGSQLNCQSSFVAGNNFALDVNNSGSNLGGGVGDFFVGDISQGQQVNFNNGVVLGSNATISITNIGTDISSTTNQNQTGSLIGYGKQLLVQSQFQAGNNLSVTILNSGFDASSGTGGNLTGFMENNTVDDSASQFHLGAGATVGDFASISLTNGAQYQGTNTNGNLVGVLAGQQFFSVTDFHAGNNFSMTARNSGRSSASGQNSHTIAQVGAGQVEFGGACVVGNNASFVLTNDGTNNDPTGTANTIGNVNGGQMMADGNFTAGQFLNMTVSNMATNVGSVNNFVGQVNGSQILFAQDCVIDNGSTINAFNSGTVTGSQIVFNQGFNLLSGQATIQAINAGSVGSFGIDVQGSNSGGDALIVLGNSSLNIATTLPTFNIGGLNGDSTSFAQSQPALIINTDATTQTNFSGVIQNFPATVSTLEKTGPGSQKLSNANTYTGLTTIQEGTLILAGSLAGDVLINPQGTLKGTGTIAGTVTNTGVISPGQSIGLL